MEEVHFSNQERSRYNRHIIIPDFGIKSQEKLAKSKVLIVGAGGLGSPLALYLAAAGIGEIGVLDCDVVEDSNLQRQVLFDTDSLGKSKSFEAMIRLKRLNPYIKVRAHDVKLTTENALDLLQDYDVIADGTDNFPTRYLVNDACVILNKINVYASIYQFEGQVSVFNYLNADGTRGPNYRDLFPVPPDPSRVQNCSEAGVLGVLPGIIGSMQALEVIKVLAQIGDVLCGKFYTFNALSFESMTYNIKKNFDNELIIKSGLIDYEQFCGMPAIEKKLKEVNPSEIHEWQQQGLAVQIIDVREPFEYELVNIGGELVPLSTVLDNRAKISNVARVVVLCKMGGRSRSAIKLLEEKYGLPNLYNLRGGIINYITELKLDLPIY
ncbi:MAG: molybdenum cofactor biosynthesis protein MoeB [Pedobacter sp.]|nr:MAG: molybdenum cofactor biosynthesis protein MoeB [Pedobacter sp.]